MNTMNSVVILSIFSAMVLAATANPNISPEGPKTDLTARHNDALAARVNLGTAISLVVPVALGVALVAFLAPMFQSLFSPIAFAPPLGYARKGKSLFSGFNKENVMEVVETIAKAIDSFDSDMAKAKRN